MWNNEGSHSKKMYRNLKLVVGLGFLYFILKNKVMPELPSPPFKFIFNRSWILCKKRFFKSNNDKCWVFKKQFFSVVARGIKKEGGKYHILMENILNYFGGIFVYIYIYFRSFFSFCFMVWIFIIFLF